MIGDLLSTLDEIEAEIEREIGSRVVYDSHDYSSSRYSGYNDGFNAGVHEAIERFRERIEQEMAKMIARRHAP